MSTVFPRAKPESFQRPRKGPGLWILLLLMGLVGGFLGFYGGGSWKMAWNLTRVERHPVETTPASVGLAFENIVFLSREDRIRLAGWWIPGAPRAPVVILIHGLDTHRAAPTVGLLDLARGLHDLGTSVLMFDLRGHGESEGSWTSGGYYEQRDVLGAVDFLEQQGISPNRIALLGVSMGGAIALMVAPKIPQLHAVIADSAFAVLRDLIANEAASRTGLPLWLTRWLVPGMEWVAWIRWHLPVSEIAPWKAVQKIPDPILLIHGAEDRRIPLAHAYRLRGASSHPLTQLWIVPGADHARAFRTDPQGYLARVQGYLTQQFPDFQRGTEGSVDTPLGKSAE